MQEQVERRKWQLGMSGELELEKWVVGKPIRTADSNTHATGTHTHIRIPAHMWQGKLNRRRQHVLQVIYFYVFGKKRKKDMAERQAQSEMPQKVKFVFQFVFFLFFVFC